MNAPLALYFGGPVGDIYQVTQWLNAFEQLAARIPSVLLVKNAQAARALAAATTLPVRLAGHADAIEPLVERHGIKALFYVNNNLSNFSPLRLAQVAHVHLSHGESEKVSMVSNQLKAYDYCFIAGTAAQERIAAALSRFDPTHLKQIGRPQLDELLACPPLPQAGDRRTVLYAPTWEGDRSAMAYSSVADGGEKWVEQILKDQNLRLIYRPHPKTGSRSRTVRDANMRISKLVTSAIAENPEAGHLVDDHLDANPALITADTAIFDVSAMAMDFSVLNRPFFVSTPEGTETTRGGVSLWTSARRLVPSEWRTLTSELHDALATGPLPGSEKFAGYHFGDITQGSSTARFESAIAGVIAPLTKHERPHDGLS